VFFVLLTLNAAWSWMFFGARSPALGLVNIAPQLLAEVILTLGLTEKLTRLHVIRTIDN
jgi:benzodiazapine receptor